MGKAILDHRFFVWVLLALPSIPMIGALASGEPDPTGTPVTEMLLHPTGEFSARFLIITMILTPLRMLFPGSGFIRWMIKRRRYFGMAAFFYALFHTVLYIVDMGSLQAMLGEFLALGIWTGWLAMLIFVPLAVTSTDSAVKRLGPRWKTLQRAVYVAAVATLLHWMFVHNNIGPALVHFVPLAALEIYRVVRGLRRRSSHPQGYNMSIRLKLLTVATVSMLPISASATGIHQCDALDSSQWMSKAQLTTNLESDGWSVRFIKEDGGCWEVYGTNPDGLRVEGYFHPATGEPELIVQRGSRPVSCRRGRLDAGQTYYATDAWQCVGRPLLCLFAERLHFLNSNDQSGVDDEPRTGGTFFVCLGPFSR